MCDVRLTTNMIAQVGTPPTITNVVYLQARHAGRRSIRGDIAWGPFRVGETRESARTVLWHASMDLTELASRAAVAQEARPPT